MLTKASWINLDEATHAAFMKKVQNWQLNVPAKASWMIFVECCIQYQLEKSSNWLLQEGAFSCLFHAFFKKAACAASSKFIQLAFRMFHCQFHTISMDAASVASSKFIQLASPRMFICHFHSVVIDKSLFGPVKCIQPASPRMFTGFRNDVQFPIVTPFSCSICYPSFDLNSCIQYFYIFDQKFYHTQKGIVLGNPTFHQNFHCKNDYFWTWLGNPIREPYFSLEFLLRK